MPRTGFGPSECARRLRQPFMPPLVRTTPIVGTLRGRVLPLNPTTPVVLPWTKPHSTRVTATKTIGPGVTSVPQKDGVTHPLAGPGRCTAGGRHNRQWVSPISEVPTSVMKMLDQLNHTTRDEANINTLGIILGRATRCIVRTLTSPPKRDVSGTTTLVVFLQHRNLLRCAASPPPRSPRACRYSHSRSRSKL